MTFQVSRNIDYLRWSHGTHKTLSKKLEGVVTWTQLSNYATCQSEPSPKILQRMEKALGLPENWCLRDNFAFTHLSEQDHQLLSAVLACDPALKRALRSFLAALKEEI